MADTKTTIEQQTVTRGSLAEPDPARRPARLALYAGGLMIVGGLAAMYLGYNGTATNAVPQAQTPYLISGGLLGLGLLLLGGIAMGLYVVLQVQADFRSELGAMRESIEQLSEAMSRQAFGVQTGYGASANGTVYVSRGTSTFHRQDCRLLSGAANVKPVPRDEADRGGLTACRICKP